MMAERWIAAAFASGLVTGLALGFTLGAADYDSGQRKVFMAACAQQFPEWECLERWTTIGRPRR